MRAPPHPLSYLSRAELAAALLVSNGSGLKIADQQPLSSICDTSESPLSAEIPREPASSTELAHSEKDSIISLPEYLK